MIRFNYRGYKIQIERWHNRFGITIEGVRCGTSLLFTGAMASAIDNVNWYESSK